ncbi:hypothetical protein VP01_1080g10 [Puccinia sorghi]|uniref:Uncharacterized protein n=1 Tax=Puccinia sorghi TaxID=27349 RepID=A0A0L6VTC2_9BASI|nr:hypothetical protein VP01_1080g10 [Puccinia sorghi]
MSHSHCHSPPSLPLNVRAQRADFRQQTETKRARELKRSIFDSHQVDEVAPQECQDLNIELRRLTREGMRNHDPWFLRMGQDFWTFQLGFFHVLYERLVLFEELHLAVLCLSPEKRLDKAARSREKEETSLPAASSLSPSHIAVQYGAKTELHPSVQWSVQNHNMLYIIKLNSPLGYSSEHFDCIIAKGFFLSCCNQVKKELYLEGQQNILCNPILSLSSSKDEPLLPLSPKPVLKSSKATVLTICHGDRAYLQPSAKRSVQNHNVLYIIKLISPLCYSSKHCDCIIAKVFFQLGGGYKRVVVELQGISTELMTKLTTNQAKIVHKLQPTHKMYQLTLVLAISFILGEGFIGVVFCFWKIPSNSSGAELIPSVTEVIKSWWHHLSDFLDQGKFREDKNSVKRTVFIIMEIRLIENIIIIKILKMKKMAIATVKEVQEDGNSRMGLFVRRQMLLSVDRRQILSKRMSDEKCGLRNIHVHLVRPIFKKSFQAVICGHSYDISTYLLLNILFQIHISLLNPWVFFSL